MDGLTSLLFSACITSQILFEMDSSELRSMMVMLNPITFLFESVMPVVSNSSLVSYTE
jgi:hypothetical protein